MSLIFVVLSAIHFLTYVLPLLFPEVGWESEYIQLISAIVWYQAYEISALRRSIEENA